jgi:hypothetical protein
MSEPDEDCCREEKKLPLHGSRFHDLFTLGPNLRFTQKLNAGT